MGWRAADKFTAMKVPRQCPLVLLVKICSRKDKTFKSGERKEVRNGAKERS
jgi:hypothetical protein